MNKKMLFLWPPASFFVQEGYCPRYTEFGETIGYFNQKPGYEVEVVDAVAEPITLKTLEDKVEERDIIAVCVQSHNILNAKKTGEILKWLNPSGKTVAFGEGAWLVPNYLLRKGKFNAVVDNYQYEYGIKEFIESLPRPHQQEQYNYIQVEKGVRSSYRQGKFLPSIPMTELSFPALDLLPLIHYKNLEGILKIRLSVGRGCNYSCEFCNVREVLGDDQRRDIKGVIKYLKKAIQLTNHFGFESATFTYNREWVFDFCNMLSKEIKDIKWSCTTRADCLDEEILSAMSSAGCNLVGLGIETLSEDTQKRIKKSIPKNIIEEMIKLIKNCGITPKTYIIIGLPKENKEEIFHTINFLEGAGAVVRPKVYADLNKFKKVDEKYELEDNYFESESRSNYFKENLAGLSENELLNIFGGKIK